MRSLRRGVVDLAFIDGMHLFEYALRDVFHTERHTRWTSVDGARRHAAPLGRRGGA